MPNPVRLRVASFGALAFLKLFGFTGVVSPWRTIYVLEDHQHDEPLLQHELAHVAQMDRDGWVTFWRQCLWWYFVPGYERSPYEIEARSVEGRPDHPLIANYELEES